MPTSIRGDSYTELDQDKDGGTKLLSYSLLMLENAWNR